MQDLIVIAVPLVIAVLVCARILYVDITWPSPVALGSAISRLCVVSADEIHSYCESRAANIARAAHLLWQADQKQIQVIRGYIRQMAWNTKLFQQVTRFEELKIDPSKSSLNYEIRETLVVSLVREATAVRWLLVRGQIELTARSLGGMRIRQHAVEKLLRLTTEYKQLEQDTVALVRMAADDCYYEMVVERLGLSNWGLIHGGAQPPQEP
jgi:hypothetical protein